MSEGDVIGASSGPRSQASLLADLRVLGIALGETLLVHASLSRLGWVAGGAQAVVSALCESLGADGTLVMPSHSTQLTDPANWQAPPVPPDWVDTIRQGFPAYDPARTPTRDMGVIAELFRNWPGTRRSSHPHYSMAARGPLAEEIIHPHALEHSLDDQSPLGRLYALDAQILLLGVGFDRCTMLHLADERVWPQRDMQTEGAPLEQDGGINWTPYRMRVMLDPDRFPPLGESLLARGLVHKGKVGSADAMLMSARLVVDEAVAAWRGQPVPL